MSCGNNNEVWSYTYLDSDSFTAGAHLDAEGKFAYFAVMMGDGTVLLSLEGLTALHAVLGHVLKKQG